MKIKRWGTGQGDIDERIERATGEVPRHSVRRRPRTVLRLVRTISNRWKCSRFQLPIYGRLRGSGLLLCGNDYITRCTQGNFLR